MELDLFLPNLQLAFEYNGSIPSSPLLSSLPSRPPSEQHYSAHFLFGPLSELQRRDDEKRAACRAKNISLIEGVTPSRS